MENFSALPSSYNRKTNPFMMMMTMISLALQATPAPIPPATSAPLATSVVSAKKPEAHLLQTAVEDNFTPLAVQARSGIKVRLQEKITGLCTLALTWLGCILHQVDVGKQHAALITIVQESSQCIGVPKGSQILSYSTKGPVRIAEFLDREAKKLTPHERVQGVYNSETYCEKFQQAMETSSLRPVFPSIFNNTFFPNGSTAQLMTAKVFGNTQIKGSYEQNSNSQKVYRSLNFRVEPEEGQDVRELGSAVKVTLPDGRCFTVINNKKRD